MTDLKVGVHLCHDGTCEKNLTGKSNRKSAILVWNSHVNVWYVAPSSGIEKYSELIA